MSKDRLIGMNYLRSGLEPATHSSYLSLMSDMLTSDLHHIRSSMTLSMCDNIIQSDILVGLCSEDASMTEEYLSLGLIHKEWGRMKLTRNMWDLGDSGSWSCLPSEESCIGSDERLWTHESRDTSS